MPMDYIREYRRFIHSHYLNGAIRITVGISLPCVLLGFLHHLSAGIVVSIGAMCVGNTDNPGPIHHRRNGMAVGILVIFVVALVMGWASVSPILTGCCVVVFCFVFSFIGIYGARATSIGVNALLIMVLNIGHPLHGWEVIRNALYVLAGGIWYMGLSLLLYSFRPYRLIQQALGDCVQATAEYLRIKASFYSPQVDYDKSYRRLLDSQSSIQVKQDLLRELIFKSRNIVRESTLTGRILTMIFLDSIDLFERIMTSQQDYRLLHRLFGDSQLLADCRKLILDLASELDAIGLAIMAGRPSVDRSTLSIRIRQLRASLAANPSEGVADLGNILDSIDDINERLHVLHAFTTYDRQLIRNFPAGLDYGRFAARQNMDRKLITDNLTLESNIFRHSLRVSAATITGYIISRFLPVGHGYWILLTVIVILKPVYSLTKQRNFQRLTGTLCGAVVGFLVIYFIHDRPALFAVMIFFMIGTYAFLRINYLVAVIFITPYVLLLFHLLFPVGYKFIIADRVLDTLIGSGIAFLANVFIIPTWEHQRIGDTMAAALKANIAYFRQVAASYFGRPASVQEYKLSRKHAFVALANLSDAFGRVLSEPRRRQPRMTEMHQFVVANQMLTSYVATLAYYDKPLAAKFPGKAWQPVADGIVSTLESAVAMLQDGAAGGASGDGADVGNGAKAGDGADVGNGAKGGDGADGRDRAKDGDGAALGAPQAPQAPPEPKLPQPAQDEPAAAKPVEDQFGFIAKVSGDLYRLSAILRPAGQPASGSRQAFRAF
ncbi:MAG TPA: FUSC family membrane protein [Puia sp.]|nr:FUSC family membrane protein [Puia sp.]